MSRLLSHIARLEAQRACLDLLADAIADVPGPVLELGLGNGRTFDHLRWLLPDRQIFVFERRLAAHPDCRPDDRYLVFGDFVDTLPAAQNRLPGPAALIHGDIGTGDVRRNAELAAQLAPLLPPLLATGGYVAFDQPLSEPRLMPLPLPAAVPLGRYHLYRRED